MLSVPLLTLKADEGVSIGKVIDFLIISEALHTNEYDSRPWDLPSERERERERAGGRERDRERLYVYVCVCVCVCVCNIFFPYEELSIKYVMEIKLSLCLMK
jgi:hypothetical protein